MQSSNPRAGTKLQRHWGNFQLLVLFACIGLVLVASVHMVTVAVSSQPACAATQEGESYTAAKRSC